MTSRAMRVAAWIDARRVPVLVASVVIAVAAAALASRLAVRADFANLLPPDEPSVQNLRAVQQRARAFGTLFLVVESGDPAVRARATAELAGRIAAYPDTLVAHVDTDDGALRRYVWAHRFLFAELADLRQARDALRARVDQAKLEVNPLYVDLGFEDEEAEVGAARTEELLARLEEAESRARAPATFVSRDGRAQLIIVRATFPASDVGRDAALLARVEADVAAVRAAHDIRVGLTGDVATTLMEQRSILRGMILAAVLTIVLCAIGLIAYYRSLAAVAMSLWSLAVGTLVTFAVTELAIGHLNLATAFLAAIVVGNGINPGLILLARYLEEARRDPGSPASNLAIAMTGAARGTLAASLAAGTAYASLIITDFRGFRHFGVIGGVGMVLCWLAAFTVLPAGLAVLRRRGLLRIGPEPAIGRWLAVLVPRRRGVVIALAGVVVALAGLETWRYVAGDPLEDDWRNLRSDNAEISRARAWNDRISDDFEGGYNRGISRRFLVAVDDPDDVPVVVERLAAADRGKPEVERLLDGTRTMSDLLPADQVEKLALLAEIRALVDEAGTVDLSEDDRATLARLRPPEDLAPLAMRDVPEALAWPFIEQDGTRGRLVFVTANTRFDTWNVRHLVRIADGVRDIELPPGALVAGQSFVMADLLEAMERDGPRASVVALVGAILVIGLVVGFGRHGAVTLACALIGCVVMIALVSLAGIKVNFLDFVALPITIGIGIDYAVNIVARVKSEGISPRAAIATTGGAVLLASFTTIVGYGSLLLSDNAGIRSFGAAAILGEIACIAAALTVAPALLQKGRAAGTRA